MKTKLLFICTNNSIRSRTAEDLFAGSERFEAKSAGISRMAPVRASQELIDWADVIFVMNEKGQGHASALRERFDLKDKKITDLDVPSRYSERGEPALVEELRGKLAEYLEN